MLWVMSRRIEGARPARPGDHTTPNLQAVACKRVVEGVALLLALLGAAEAVGQSLPRTTF